MTRLPLISILSIASFAVGCAMQHAPQAAVRPPLPPAPASTSLAFTPAVARDVGELDLDRGDRGTFASAGFEQNVISTTYTYTDDDQRYFGRRGGRGGDDSQYERRSISTSVTVRGQ